MRFERVRVLSVSPVALLRAGDEDKFVSLRQKYPNEARRGGEGVVQRRGMKKTIHSTRCMKESLGQGKGRRASKLEIALASNERYLLVPTALFQIFRNRDLFQSVARTQNSQGRGIPSSSPPPQHNDWTRRKRRRRIRPKALASHPSVRVSFSFFAPKKSLLP